MDDEIERNPNAPEGTTPLVFGELSRDDWIVTYFMSATRPWQMRWRVRRCYPEWRKVVVAPEGGDMETCFAADLGVEPGPHGWSRNYSVRA